jgi:peptide/nickel transport system permease protein
MANEYNQNEIKPAKKSLGPWALAYRRFIKNKLALVGVFMITIAALVAIFADVITPIDPVEFDLYNVYGAPDETHLLGTDSSGRDAFSRLVHGARISLLIGFFAMLFTILIGTILGSISGYYGGKVDGIIMRFTDIMLNFPFLLFFLTVASILQRVTVVTFIMVIAFVSWPGVTRIIRGTYLQLRGQEFILGAKSIGCSDSRIIFKHLLPNAMGPIIVNATLTMAVMIIAESGLSFIGFGIPQPTPTWGNMLADAQALLVLRQHPNLWIPPGLAILFTVLAINFIGDGLRDALDPRTRR